MKIIAIGLAAMATALPLSDAQATTFTVTIPEATQEYIGTGNASVTYSGVTFSTNATIGSTYLFNVGPNSGANPRVISSQQATSGIPNLLVTLPEVATSISISYGTFLGSAVNFLLSGGSSSVLGSSSGSGYSAPDIFMASGSISSVLLTTGDSTLNIRSVTYTVGETEAVPEVATWAMFIIGFGLTGKAMRHPRKIGVRFA